MSAVTDQNEQDGIVLTPEQKRARRQRSIAIAVLLVVLAVLFYMVTLVKGPGVLNRPLRRWPRSRTPRPARATPLLMAHAALSSR